MARIDNILHLSTAHITKRDADLLEAEGPNKAHFVREEGFVVWTEWLDDEEFFPDLSPSFHKCVHFALRDFGCAWIMFDRDEPVNPKDDLDTHEW